MGDTIDVRPDEQLDEARLRTFIAANLDALPVSQGEFTLRQFGGGMANLTYELDFGEERLVLRRPPLGEVAASAHDMGREYRVLSRLHQLFPLAPRAYLYCEDSEVIGAPFFVMERRYGQVVRRVLPPEYGDDPQAPRRMSEALVDALAALHAVDYEAAGLSDLGRPEGFISRQIDGWYRRWQRAKTVDLPVMERVHDWLSTNEPAYQAAALVHNDFKLDNVMFAADDPGRMVAIFDWDMCTLGDPLSDLGALLTYWSDSDDPPYMHTLASTFMPVGDRRFLTRGQLVERYARQSGRSVVEINFYHALGLFRLTVILAQIYVRYVRGQTKDPRFARLGELLPLLAQASAAVAGI